METIDVETSVAVARRRPRWRPPSWRRWPWRPIAVVAAVSLALVAVQAWDSDSAASDGGAVEAAPAPEVGLSARQETMMLHHLWQKQVVIRECMGERGLDYVPNPAIAAGQLDAVSTLLSVDPASVPAPVPAVVNARVAQQLDDAQSQVWERALTQRVDDGGCEPPPQLLYIDNEAALADAEAAALGDQPFLDFVSHALALEGDPVAQLRGAVLEPGTAAPGPAPQHWSATATRVEEAVASERLWIVGEPRGTEAFVDIAGLTADGGALLVRVAVGSSGLLSSAGPAVGPVLECGEMLVQVALWPPADPEQGAATAQSVLVAISAAICDP